MEHITPFELNENLFSLLDRTWMLITARDPETGKINTMTASWGGFGILWNKPVAFVFIRPQRYTYELLEKTDVFSMSFFGGEYKKELTYFGRNSGRDGDKYEATGFTTVKLDGTECVEQAKVNLVLKKLAFQDIDPKGFLDESIEGNYNGDYHRVYVAEIVKTYIAE